jgi:hypothetical protein
MILLGPIESFIALTTIYSSTSLFTIVGSSFISILYTL